MPADRDPKKPPGPSGRGSQRKGFLLRLPEPLLEDLRSWAAADLRSLNAHIEYLLRDAVRRRRGDKD